jgi:hypothetical protein
MSGHSILAFEEACRTIANHRLLRAIDWYADCACNPSSSSLRIDYGAEGLGFPHMEIDWKDTPAEVIAAAEFANALYNQRFVVTDTTRKLCFGMNAIARSPVVDHDGFLAIEYHAEGYFVRMGALGEQVVRLVGLTLALPNVEERRIQELARSAAAAMPTIAYDLGAFQHALRVVKSRRNEAAHESTFSDERLTGLRGMLSPSAAFGFHPSRQELDVVKRYRIAFLETAASEMTHIAQHICAVFEHLVSSVDEYSNAEVTRQRKTREPDILPT